MDEISIILPARNEASSLEKLLPKLRSLYSDAQIIVVDDNSIDATEAICMKNNVERITNMRHLGNGGSIKAGTRRASGKKLVFMDADGQHSPEDIPGLLAKLEEGFDMAVGARSKKSQASIGRLLANSIYNRLSSWIVNSRIQDLTSGFRAVDAEKFRQFLYLLPNGFSYPTTITMSFFRAGYSIAYIPIEVKQRIGKSHINVIRDGIRFLVIIFKVGTLYSPLKIFLPISVIHFILGAAYYAYTYVIYERFTNMSALLFISSIIIFLIGLVSEQITTLLFKDSEIE